MKGNEILTSVIPANIVSRRAFVTPEISFTSVQADVLINLIIDLGFSGKT